MHARRLRAFCGRRGASGKWASRHAISEVARLMRGAEDPSRLLTLIGAARVAPEPPDRAGYASARWTSSRIALATAFEPAVPPRSPVSGAPRDTIAATARSIAW